MASLSAVLSGLVGFVGDEPAVGLALLAAGARVVEANRRFEALTATGKGQAPGELAPDAWARVGPSAVEMALSQRRPVLVRYVHGGQPAQCSIWPLPEGAGGQPLCLALACVGAAQPLAGPRGEPTKEGFILLGPSPVRGEPTAAQDDPLAALTRRELEVLALIGMGLATREAAAALGRSPRTVERHCDAIHKKLGTTNRVQMARYAIEAGLTPEKARTKRSS